MTKNQEGSYQCVSSHKTSDGTCRNETSHGSIQLKMQDRPHTLEPQGKISVLEAEPLKFKCTVPIYEDENNYESNFKSGWILNTTISLGNTKYIHNLTIVKRGKKKTGPYGGKK